jgi:carbon-monoxide dehydrogenase large subunit
VVVAGDLGSRNGPFPHPTWFPPRAELVRQAAAHARQEEIRLLAADRVRYAGEPLAAVIANDRYLAEDAAALVVIDCEPLPVLRDPEDALADGAVLLHPEWGTNVAGGFRVRKGDPDVAFASADTVVSGTYRLPRQTGTPIEARGVHAVPGEDGTLTVWSSSQAPHWLRDALVTSLGLERDAIRVVAPDVGGGFGIKSMVYPEELLVPALALQLGSPLRWADTRRESFLASVQSRSQVHEIALAIDADGTIRGLRDRYLVDGGASNVEAFVVPYNTAAHLQGPYRVPSLELECTIVLTNKQPLSAYRGAGRPEATFAMERIIDLAARRLGLTGSEIRRRNTLTTSEMPYPAGIPYRDGSPMIVDGGDYAACLELAVGAISQPGDTRRIPDGRLRGTGIAAYIEGTGIGPHESARVVVDSSGDVSIEVALPSQGQGHQTVLAQVCSSILDVPIERISVHQGDTWLVAEGGGTIASRTAVVVGNAVGRASESLRRMVIEAAAAMLEAAERDLVLESGRVSVIGSPDRSVSLTDVAAERGPLEAEERFAPDEVTFSNGVHAAQVAVDPETGDVAVERYVVVHDCGRVINPLILEGQVAGGVAQGIGGALFEELVHDDNGQLVNGSFMDYGLPRSTDLPDVEVIHVETPSTRNPLGVKGAGEAGTIAVAAAIAGAVDDALARFGATVTICPVTPQRVLAMIRQGDASRDAVAQPVASAQR